GLLAAGWNGTKVSVAPAVAPPGAPAARVVATATAGASFCQMRWNGASDRLVYVTLAKDSKHATLSAVNADGTGRRALTGPTDAGICNATWSPSGSTIAYVKNYALHLPIAEYHEAMVIRDGHTVEAHLHLSNKVHLESVLAIA